VATLALLSFLCAGVALLFAADLSFRHWLQGPRWASFVHPHAPTILVAFAALGGSVVLAAALCILWLVRRKESGLSARAFIAWLTALLASAGAFLLPYSAYLVMAVLLLGPGQHSRYLQTVAANSDSVALLRALAFRETRIDDDLLCYAATQDSPAVVLALIEWKTSVNAASCARKRTPLHSAVEGRRYANVRILLEAGASDSAADESGLTPRDLAARLGDEQMLRILSRK
jgi:hypothetical protein